MKITLRKAAALGIELRRQISNSTRTVTDARVTTLRAVSLKTPQEAVDEALADRSNLLSTLELLQSVATKVRRAVALGNDQYGVNEILHNLREAEDVLAIKKAFYVDTEARQRSRRSSSYDNLDECLLQLRIYNESVEKGVERPRGLSEVSFKLPAIDSVQEDVKALERKIKTIKNEELLRANLNEVEVTLTGDELALLTELNVL